LSLTVSAFNELRKIVSYFVLNDQLEVITYNSLIQSKLKKNVFTVLSVNQCLVNCLLSIELFNNSQNLKEGKSVDKIKLSNLPG
jgi:hypothetical protein